MGKGVYPVKATVMEGDLPIDTNACGTYVLPCFSLKQLSLQDKKRFTNITLASNLITC